MSTSDPFFSSKNEAMLDRLLYTDIQRRAGTDLSDKQKERLLRTVRHYMKEVDVKNPGQAVQDKNKEVLTAVVPDYMSYLRRSAGPVMDDGDLSAQGLEKDVNTRFGQLQAARQERRYQRRPTFASLLMKMALPQCHDSRSSRKCVRRRLPAMWPQRPL